MLFSPFRRFSFAAFLFIPGLLLVSTESGVSAARPGSRLQGRTFSVTSTRYFYAKSVSLLSDPALGDWTTVSGKPVGSGWEVVDGVLHRKSGAGDIITKKQYGDFALDFAWTIAKKGNSGIKYKFRKYDVGGWLGCEFQVLDDFNNSEGKRIKHESGALYDIIAPKNQILHPHDQLNRGRIVVTGDRIRHFLNGGKTVDLRTGTPDWEALLAASKFNKTKDFGAVPTGHLHVQDHGDEVWFHEMTVREITPVKYTTFYKRGLFGKVRRVRR